jgi:hypothetical protein
MAYEADETAVSARLLGMLPGVTDRPELAGTPGWGSWPREPWAGPALEAPAETVAAVREQVQALGGEWIATPESAVRLRMTYSIYVAACGPYGRPDPQTGTFVAEQPGSDLYDRYGFSGERPIYGAVGTLVEVH